MYLLKFHNDTASFHARSLWYRYLRKISKSIVPSSTADDIDLLQILTVDTEIAENCIVESYFLNVSKCIPALDRFIYFLLTSILDYTRSMLQFEHCYRNIQYFNSNGHYNLYSISDFYRLFVLESIFYFENSIFKSSILSRYFYLVKSWVIYKQNISIDINQYLLISIFFP